MIYKKLKELCVLKNGYAFKSKDFSQIGVPVIKIKNIKPNKIVLEGLSYVPKEIADSKTEYKINKGDIVITMTGNRVDGSPDSWVGKVALFREEGTYLLNQRLAIIRPISEEVDLEYLAYYLSSWETQLYFIKRANSSGGQANISPSIVGEYDIALPSKEVQKKIASLLRDFDLKIRLNTNINNNLLEQVLTLYRNKFVDTANNERSICRADEYFDISIGKTPPRKEPQWFSTNPQDVTWVSISDMGTCGLYISSSSEQLTKQAVERHNVKLVPDNTVLLSFKLTVGRIAITNGEMTTNEAIAHFKTDKKEINEYLYCYLKCFNYQTMGSTSSIATAVNSKIIKGMPFVVPTNDELEEFHIFAAPMFAKIKANQIETDNLTALRDTLLPKLMSGELDVSNIDI